MILSIQYLIRDCTLESNIWFRGLNLRHENWWILMKPQHCKSLIFIQYWCNSYSWYSYSDIHNRHNFVLTYTRSDWCREENGRGPDPECVRTIRPLRRSSECHDISEPVPVRHSGKIRQRETEHTGRLWQPSDWSSGINTDITSGMIDVIFRPTFFSRYLEINFHRLQKWLSPFHGFFVLIGFYKKSTFY